MYHVKFVQSIPINIHTGIYLQVSWQGLGQEIHPWGLLNRDLVLPISQLRLDQGDISLRPIDRNLVKGSIPGSIGLENLVRGPTAESLGFNKIEITREKQERSLQFIEKNFILKCVFIIYYLKKKLNYFTLHLPDNIPGKCNDSK